MSKGPHYKSFDVFFFQLLITASFCLAMLSIVTELLPKGNKFCHSTEIYLFSVEGELINIYFLSLIPLLFSFNFMLDVCFCFFKMLTSSPAAVSVDSHQGN